MGQKTGISWTGATWNPWHGCIKVSSGCKNCYMYRDKERFGQDPRQVVKSKTAFNSPLKWTEPRLIFTCSWSDFFIEEADEWRAEAWEIIKNTPQHTYQILTKRPERIIECLPKDWGDGYENVWLGVSVEDEFHNWRAQMLSTTPAKVRFISAEPLIGPIDSLWLTRIHWVIAGGESGPDFRPMKPEWATLIRDQCRRFGVAFFHKQNGGNTKIDGEWGGNLLDGQVYQEFPA